MHVHAAFVPSHSSKVNQASGHTFTLLSILHDSVIRATHLAELEAELSAHRSELQRQAAIGAALAAVAEQAQQRAEAAEQRAKEAMQALHSYVKSGGEERRLIFLNLPAPNTVRLPHSGELTEKFPA